MEVAIQSKISIERVGGAMVVAGMVGGGGDEKIQLMSFIAVGSRATTNLYTPLRI